MWRGWRAPALLLLPAACAAPGEESGKSRQEDSEVEESAAPDTGESGPGETGPGETGPGETSAEGAVPLVVNELMAENLGSVTDDLGAASDWLELYNAGDEALDLGGFTLSDDWTQPGLSALPEGTTLEAGGFLVLWADGQPELGDRHLGFRLAQGGEGVGVFDSSGEVVDWVVYGPQEADTSLARIPDGAETWEQTDYGTPGETNALVELVELSLVASGDTWRYDDSGVESEGDWRAVDFDDSGWSSGASPLGYGDTHATTLGYGDDANDKHPTTWLRLALEVDPSELAGAREATLELMVDDGALVWLNGEELARHNLADGEVGADDYASVTVSGDDETAWTAYEVDPALLLDQNVLAVELHQASATSSDLQLDLTLTLISAMSAAR